MKELPFCASLESSRQNRSAFINGGRRKQGGIASTKRTQQVQRLAGLSRRKVNLSSVSRKLPSLPSVGSRREILVSDVRHCGRPGDQQAKYIADRNRNTRCYSSDSMTVPESRILRDTLGNHVLPEGRHESGNCLEPELVASCHCEFAMLALCCSSNPTGLCRLVDKPLGNWRRIRLREFHKHAVEHTSRTSLHRS